MHFVQGKDLIQLAVRGNLSAEVLADTSQVGRAGHLQYLEVWPVASTASGDHPLRLDNQARLSFVFSRSSSLCTEILISPQGSKK